MATGRKDLDRASSSNTQVVSTLPAHMLFYRGSIDASTPSMQVQHTQVANPSNGSRVYAAQAELSGLIRIT